MAKRNRDPRDAAIGKRVRALRLHRGMSQTTLGDSLDLTFQQVQKYERGTNRISAGRLHRIAELLDVPITFFYTGFEDSKNKRDSDPVGIEFDYLQTDDVMRLVRSYARIKRRGVQLHLVKLTETLASD
jgi:transcriptional regulator with XRE-family HTH domain